MKKLFGLLLVLAVVIAWSVPQTVHAQNYKPEYKLSTVVGKPFPWGIAGERWAELVKEKTNGRINIKCYPGTSLVGGDQTKEYTAIRQGSIDMVVGSTINWSPQVKELNIFSMPPGAKRMAGHRPALPAKPGNCIRPVRPCRSHCQACRGGLHRDGTDFDGGGGLADCRDAAELGNITQELVRRGYSKKDIGKIWGGNVMRVFAEAIRFAEEGNN